MPNVKIVDGALTVARGDAVSSTSHDMETPCTQPQQHQQPPAGITSSANGSGGNTSHGSGSGGDAAVVTAAAALLPFRQSIPGACLPPLPQCMGPVHEAPATCSTYPEHNIHAHAAPDAPAMQQLPLLAAATGGSSGGGASPAPLLAPPLEPPTAAATATASPFSAVCTSSSSGSGGAAPAATAGLPAAAIAAATAATCYGQQPACGPTSPDTEGWQEACCAALLQRHASEGAPALPLNAPGSPAASDLEDFTRQIRVQHQRQHQHHDSFWRLADEGSGVASEAETAPTAGRHHMGAAAAVAPSTDGGHAQPPPHFMTPADFLHQKHVEHHHLQQQQQQQEQVKQRQRQRQRARRLSTQQRDAAQVAAAPAGPEEEVEAEKPAAVTAAPGDATTAAALAAAGAQDSATAAAADATAPARAGPAAAAAAASAAATAAADSCKPLFHVMPLSGWGSDPNGPIFYKGRYHL